MSNQYLLDVIAVLWLVLAWLGYSYFSGVRSHHVSCLKSIRNEYILRWMQSFNNREIRIADATFFTILERNVAFFASTSMLVLIGLLSGLMNLEQILSTMNKMVFFDCKSLDLLAAKLLLLIAIYIYAVFTFTWSMRQYNMVIMMVGGAPQVGEDEKVRQKYAEKVANVLHLASNTFNYGLRAYYFSLAALSWFIHPVLFMLLTLWVVLVLYRREFSSKTLKAMQKV